MIRGKHFIFAVVLLMGTLVALQQIRAEKEGKSAIKGEPVVLINMFTVPPNKLDDAIVLWEAGRDFLKHQPGYISTNLHQSLSSDAKYLLINVAKWESVETYQAANKKMHDNSILPRVEGVIPQPALYKVIRE